MKAFFKVWDRAFLASIFLYSLFISSAAYNTQYSNPTADEGERLYESESDEYGTENYGDTLDISFIGQWADGPCYAVDVEGDIACFGNRRYLEIVDFADPENPVELGNMQFPYPVEDIAIDDQYAYVIDGQFRIIDISDPENPMERGSCEITYTGVNIDVDGNYAYIANNGLSIIDISIRENPHVEGFYELSGAVDVSVIGDHAYVAVGHDDLHVIDISNPVNPEEVGYFDTQDMANAVAVYEQYILIASGISGVWVLDVSDPKNPNPIGPYDIGEYPIGIEIMGDYG